MCVRCKVEEDALRLDLMDRGEALNRQEDDLRLRQRELDEAKREASDLQLREEALRLELMHQGEALNRRGDNLRLQQNRLNKATEDHKKAVKKAQEQQANYIATSYQRKRTNGPLQYTNIK